MAQIYEKNPDIGGTWYENRYPGCACDIPSHSYTFSFEPKLNFPAVYSGPDQIRAYLDEFCSKYMLRQFIHTGSTVISASWDQEISEWLVEVRKEETGEVIQDRCDILIHATGYLNKPRLPKVAGLDRFRGVILHTASYDDQVSLAGKKVLLVGAGSSAVQALPAIQPFVDKVTIFIRSPSWFLPQIDAKRGLYSGEEIRRFASNPDLVTKIRQGNERVMNSIFSEVSIQDVHGAEVDESEQLST